MVYYDNGEIYLDFKTVFERTSLSESTLFRRLRNKKVKGVRYRNRMLFKYTELIELFRDEWDYTGLETKQTK